MQAPDIYLWKFNIMNNRTVRCTSLSGRLLRPKLMSALLCALLSTAIAPSVHAQAGLTAPGEPRPSLTLAPTRALAPAPAPVISAPAAVPAKPSSGAARAKPAMVDAIVAVVNNEVITHQDLEARVRLVEQRMKAQGVSMPPAGQFRKQLLERMIVDKAQLQLAKENGITVDDLFLDKAVARIAEQNKMSLQELRNQLERDGTAFSVFREGIREEVVMQRLREREVDNKIQISESEVEAFLAANAGSAQSALPEVNLAQILIRIPENASPEQISQRRQRAEEALQQLRTGGEFAKVAVTFSDGSDALRGGEIGWRGQERLPQLFVDAIADRKLGEIAVVKSANGFHILKVLGRRDAQAAKTNGALPAVQQTRVRHILIKVNQVTTAADARHKLTELKERLERWRPWLGLSWRHRSRFRTRHECAEAGAGQ
jgi:peptidyl-prolyl cis-trans isomerase SurA